jgi:hypothetical protein
MLKKQIIVLKTIKLSMKILFSIDASPGVFRREIKRLLRLDYML